MRPVIALCLLLPACDAVPKQTDSTVLAMRAGEQSAEIAQLRAEVSELHNEQRMDHIKLGITETTALETASSLDSLRNTVNGNVRIDNKRAAAAFNMTQSIDDRLSRYDGQHSTR